MNINMKILNKILVNQIQNYAFKQKTPHDDQVEFIPGLQHWLITSKISAIHY